MGAVKRLLMDVKEEWTTQVELIANFSNRLYVFSNNLKMHRNSEMRFELCLRYSVSVVLK